MGSASSKFKKYIQHGDEFAAMQIYQSSPELRKSLDPNLSYGENHQHNTALHYAAKHGMKHLLRTFLNDHGGNPNKKNGKNENVLHAACQVGPRKTFSSQERRAACVALLLQWRGFELSTGEREKVEVDAQDSNGNSPLHAAASSGLQRCVELLLAAGSPLFLENNDKMTPCDTAVKAEHHAIARLLESRMVFADDSSSDTVNEVEIYGCNESGDEVYSGLRTQDLQEAKDQLLVETSDMLNIPLFTAEALLRDNEWSRESLLEKWIRDPVKCCQVAGVKPPPSAYQTNAFGSGTITPVSKGSLTNNLSEDCQAQVSCCQGIRGEMVSTSCGGGLYPDDRFEDKAEEEVEEEEEGGGEEDDMRGCHEEEKVIENIECQICYSEVPKQDWPTISMTCDHQFCSTCWECYLTGKIQEGGEHRILCPAHHCHILVPSELIEKLVAPDIARRYLQFDIKAFVETNRSIKWCPMAGCGRAVRLPEIEHNRPSEMRTSHAVDCGNGHFFCWECLGEAHAPSACSEWQKWLAKISEVRPEELSASSRSEHEDAANCLWLVTNSKPCPNCQSPIQKSEGCNHMKCSKCKYDFCWVCLESWKRHNSTTGGYFRCNRFEAVHKADEKQGVLINEAMVRNQQTTELNRFLHYYTRFRNHENSRRLEEPLLTGIRRKMEALASTRSKKGDTECTKFVEEGVRELLKARRILCGSYVHGYYLEDNGYSRTIFEFMQNELEEATEKLSEMVARPYLRTPKGVIVQTTALTRRKRHEFARAVSKGLVPPETPPSLRRYRKRNYRVVAIDANDETAAEVDLGNLESLGRRVGPIGLGDVLCGMVMVKTRLQQTALGQVSHAIAASLKDLDSEEDGWVKDAQGKHNNMSGALYGLQDLDSEEESEVNRALAVSLLGECAKVGCTRPRAHDARTSTLYEYCSQRCSKMAAGLDSYQVNVTSDYNMDLVIALEMSRLQMIEDEMKQKQREEGNGAGMNTKSTGKSSEPTGSRRDDQINLAVHLAFQDQTKSSSISERPQMPLPQDIESAGSFSMSSGEQSGDGVSILPPPVSIADGMNAGDMMDQLNTNAQHKSPSSIFKFGTSSSLGSYQKSSADIAVDYFLKSLATRNMNLICDDATNSEEGATTHDPSVSNRSTSTWDKKRSIEKDTMWKPTCLAEDGRFEISEIHETGLYNDPDEFDGDGDSRSLKRSHSTGDLVMKRGRLATRADEPRYHLDSDHSSQHDDRPEDLSRRILAVCSLSSGTNRHSLTLQSSAGSTTCYGGQSSLEDTTTSDSLNADLEVCGILGSSAADDELTSKSTVSNMQNVIHLATLPRNLATIGKKNALDLGDADHRQSLSDELLACHDKNSLSLSSESSDQNCCGLGTNDFDSESSSSSAKLQVGSSELERRRLKPNSAMSSSKSLTNVCVRSRKSDAIFEERTNCFIKVKDCNTAATKENEGDVGVVGEVGVDQNLGEKQSSGFPHSLQRLPKNLLTVNGRGSPSPPTPSLYTALYQPSCSKFTFDEPSPLVISSSCAPSSILDSHLKSETKLKLEDTIFNSRTSPVSVTASNITPTCHISSQPSRTKCTQSFSNNVSMQTSVFNYNSPSPNENKSTSTGFDVNYVKHPILSKDANFEISESEFNQLYENSPMAKSLSPTLSLAFHSNSTINVNENIAYNPKSSLSSVYHLPSRSKSSASAPISETEFSSHASKSNIYPHTLSRISPVHLQTVGNNFFSISPASSSMNSLSTLESYQTSPKFTPLSKTSSNPLPLQSKVKKVGGHPVGETLAALSITMQEQDGNTFDSSDKNFDNHNFSKSIGTPSYVINPLTLSPPNPKAATLKKMKRSYFGYQYNDTLTSNSNESDMLDIEALNIISPAGSWNNIDGSIPSESVDNIKSDIFNPSFYNDHDKNTLILLKNGNSDHPPLRKCSALKEDVCNISDMRNNEPKLYERRESSHNLLKTSKCPSSLLFDDKVCSDINGSLNSSTLNSVVRKERKSTECVEMNDSLSTIDTACHSTKNISTPKDTSLKLKLLDSSNIGKPSRGFFKRSSMPTEFMSTLASGFNIDNRQSKSSMTLNEASFEQSFDGASFNTSVKSVSKQSLAVNNTMKVGSSVDVTNEVSKGWVNENRQSRSSSMPNDNVCRSSHTGSGKLGRHAAHGLRITITGGNRKSGDKKSNRLYSDEDDDDFNESNNCKKLSCLETDSSNEYESETGIPKSPTLFISGVSISRTPEPKSPASCIFGRQSRSSSLTVPIPPPPSSPSGLGLGSSGLLRASPFAATRNNSQSLTAALGLSFRRRVQPSTATFERSLITSSIPGALYSSCCSPGGFVNIDKPEKIMSNSSSHKSDPLALKELSVNRASASDLSDVNSNLSISSTPPSPRDLSAPFIPASQSTLENNSTSSPISTSSISLSNCPTVDCLAATPVPVGNGGLVKSSTDGALSSVLHVREGSLGSDDFHEALFLLERSPKVGKGSKRRKRSKREQKQKENMEQMEASSAL